MEYEILFRNATIIDGTGAPWYRATVGVANGKIKTVTRKQNETLNGKRTIDCTNHVLSPGFIDTHSHSDLAVFNDSAIKPKLRQGITTEVLGQDGFSMAPMYRKSGPSEWQDHLAGLAGRHDIDWTWESTKEYFDAIEENGTAINLGMHVGHGTVRFNVMGMADRSPSTEELKEMQALITESLDQGALGFSTGLVYTPQLNANTEEIQTLASTLADYNRPFVAHIRNEREDIWNALDEFVDIGATEEVPLHLSHFKVAGKPQHGKATRAIHLLETARDRGVDITVEQYPYPAGNTMLSSRLPSWIFRGNQEDILARLSDPEVRTKIKDEYTTGGPDWPALSVTNLTSEAQESVEGERITTIAQNRDQHPVDVVCDILIAEDMAAGVISHSMDEHDVKEIMACELVCIATDGLLGGKPHPRTYGTYPRILGRYVREHNHLSIEEAIRKMTALPARAMGLYQKGIVRPGLDADLVVFDPATIKNRATFENPTQHPIGIKHVVVNGESAVRNGNVTDNRPGQVLRASQ